MNVKFMGKLEFALNQSQKTVTVQCEKVKNMDTRASGPFSLSVWAAVELHENGFSGYPLARLNLGPLGPKQVYKGISQTLPVLLPPPATYQIALSLDHEGTLRSDYRIFEVTHNFHTNQLKISGPCYYTIEAGKIVVQITKITNSTSAQTGPLKVEL